MYLSAVLLNLLIVAAFSCPSTDWVQCSAVGQTCTIPNTINATTIAYGDDTNQIWTFAEIQNYAKPAKTLSIGCHDSTFGSIDPNVNKECCYNPTGSTIAVESEFGKESSWKIAGNAQDQTFDVPYADGFPRWVRYGSNGQYIYRLFSYQVDCVDTLFGNPTGSSNNMCWYLNSVYNMSNWIACGSNTNKECNLEVDTTAKDIIRIVKYGQYNTSQFAYHDQFHYRFVYSQNSGSIPCTDDFFVATNIHTTNFCYVAAVQASNFFINPVGYWAEVGSCSDCVLTKTLQYGVSSTSTYAATTTWSEELTETVSKGAHFLFFSESYSLSYSVSESISTTMSESFQVSAKETCSAKCSNGNKTGQYYMYQWAMTIGEIIDTDVVPFKAFLCHIVCTNSPKVVPECPLNYCKNDNCTVCYQWKNNTVHRLKF